MCENFSHCAQILTLIFVKEPGFDTFIRFFKFLFYYSLFFTGTMFVHTYFQHHNSFTFKIQINESFKKQNNGDQVAKTKKRIKKK